MKQALLYALVLVVSLVLGVVVTASLQDRANKVPEAVPVVTPTPTVTPLNPMEMRPIYRGESLSWKQAKRLQRSGKATQTLLFSDDSGDYVLLFDTVPQLDLWECRHVSSHPSKCKES